MLVHRVLPAAALVAGVVALALVLRPAFEPTPPLTVSVRGTDVVVVTSTPAVVRLEYGPTRRYGLFSAPQGPVRSHSFSLASLAPGSTYHLRALAGARTSGDAILRTPPHRGPHLLRIAGDRFELDGRPWIPRFTWGSCAGEYAGEAALGVNAFMSSNCGDPPARQARAAQRVGAVVIPAVDQARRGLDAIAATYVADEPDLRSVAPASLEVSLRTHPDAHGLPVFLTLSHLAAAGDRARAALYSGYAGLADALGIDVYPVFATGDERRVGDVSTAQQAVVALAGGKPTFQWIEATGPDPAHTPRPRDVELEAWLAILGGARGLGWWTFGTTTPFAVDPGDRAAIRRVDLALDTFAPALAAPPAPVTLENRGTTVYGTRRNGALTIFAANSSPAQTVNQIFDVPGLAGRSVRVWNSGRVIRGSGDSFADTLPPFAWRIYLVAPG